MVDDQDRRSTTLDQWRVNADRDIACSNHVERQTEVLSLGDLILIRQAVVHVGIDETRRISRPLANCRSPVCGANKTSKNGVARGLNVARPVQFRRELGRGLNLRTYLDDDIFRGISRRHDRAIERSPGGIRGHHLEELLFGGRSSDGWWLRGGRPARSWGRSVPTCCGASFPRLVAPG